MQETFNERIRNFIEHQGIIKHRVAEVAGITPSAFFRFLNGTSSMKSSNIEKLNKVWPEMIAYALDIDPFIAKTASELDNQMKSK